MFFSSHRSLHSIQSDWLTGTVVPVWSAVSVSWNTSSCAMWHSGSSTARRPTIRLPPMTLWGMVPRFLLRPPAPLDGGCFALLPAALVALRKLFLKQPAPDESGGCQFVTSDAASAARQPHLEEAARRHSMFVLNGPGLASCMTMLPIMEEAIDCDDNLYVYSGASRRSSGSSSPVTCAPRT